MQSETNSNNSGKPIKVAPLNIDNHSLVCKGNKCVKTDKNYYGTRWLYN